MKYFTVAILSFLTVGCGGGDDDPSNSDSGSARNTGAAVTCNTNANDLQGCWVSECFLGGTDIGSKIVFEFTTDGKRNISNYSWNEDLTCEGEITGFSDSYYYGGSPDSYQIQDQHVTTNLGEDARVLELTLLEDNTTHIVSFAIVQDEICFEQSYLKWAGTGTMTQGSSISSGYSSDTSLSGFPLSTENCLQRLDKNTQ